MTLEDAVAITGERAKSEGILVDFLNRYGTEVTGMLRGITVEEYGEIMKKEGFEDGKAEGLEQGRSEGLAQGRNEGLAEGEASGRAAEKLEMARAMKAKEYSVDEISELTGLPVEEINKL